MRKLGKRWQSLHRAVYAIGLLAVLHYWWHKAGKNDFAQPLIYASVLALLLGWRVAAWLRRRR
jgi:sulfoxide reductase heme-binding subunit YedZ